jgi:8-oxo-dGTP pyrophosphatase MutT (NUDIX family)
MELNTEPSQSPVRAAASIVMLRDAAPGLEVFLVKRHGLSDVLGGAYVFPGGKVDTDDAHLDLAKHMDLAPAQLHEALHEPGLQVADAVALHVAAMREAFEETGVLYAQDADEARTAQAWALLREGRAFDEVLAAMQLRLRSSALQPWSRWITPVVGGVIRKRFDTRFFLATVPAGQTARHDSREATDSVWLTPRDALRQYWEGQIELAPPQIMGLAHLARHASVSSALQEARSRKPPLILPESFEEEGVRVVCYPGDERHSIRERALPGPTRLHFRNRRFEPADGLEALFVQPS